MRYKTMISVALLAISSAALAQVTKPTTTPPKTAMNSTEPTNSMSPSDSTMSPDSMNTQDETMMNDSSMPNSTMAPK